MAARKPQRIGVWIDPTTHAGRGAIGGIIHAAQHHDWRLTQDLSDVDGAIADLGAKVPENMPAVRVLAGDPMLSSVTSDENSVALMAIEHFRSRGFRHFVFIGDHDTDEARGDAFALAIENNRVRNGGDEGSFAREDAAHTFSDAELAAWVQALPQPLACFCGCDAIAAGVVRGLKTCPLQTPVSSKRKKGANVGPGAAVAVLGVGDDPLICAFAEMPISSIDLNYHQIGRRAVEALTRRLGGKSVKPIFVPPIGVTERSSTQSLGIDDEDVVAALHFIHAHAASAMGMGMDDLVRAMQLPRRTLERRFAKVLNRSPAEVLRRQRIAIAQRLLTTSDAGMSEIARHSGFALPQHLAAAFKQTTGQTPTEFRRQILG